jgi:predicted alpha/beta-hydrolase family hydrolase
VSNSSTPEAFAVGLDAGQSVTALHYAAGQPASGAAFIVAHGAGAGHQSPFMVDFARALATLGFDTVTFNFPYTEQRRRLPDRAPVLEACYAAVIEETRRRLESARHALFIGGKSMGGRMATQLAAAKADLPVAGLVLLGYPLHPPGQPHKRRDAHLPSVRRPMLVIQGSRDSFGTPEELAPAFGTLDPPATLHVIAGGDHSFKVPRADAARRAAIDDEVRRTAVEWMTAIMRGRRASQTPIA